MILKTVEFENGALTLGILWIRHFLEIYEQDSVDLLVDYLKINGIKSVVKFYADANISYIHHRCILITAIW